MSATITDRHLLAYLTGALEPGRRLEIREEIGADPALQFRLTTLSGRLAESGPRPSLWRIPPPDTSGVPWMLPGRVEIGRHAILGEENTPGLSPGQPFQLRIDPVSNPWAWRVIVLYRRDGAWEVVFTTWPDEELTLMDLPQEANGELRLDLIARPEPGPQRWALALAPTDLEVDWQASEDQRWTELQLRIVRGQIRLMVVEVDVG